MFKSSFLILHSNVRVSILNENAKRGNDSYPFCGYPDRINESL